jgi:uncharacterized membrane protein YeaQ/YmgE (transglycosylase-associated protein family)
MLLTILFWIVFGGIAGWIATIIAGQNNRVNGWMNILVGIVGAVLGGLVFRLFGGTGVTGFNFYSFLVAIVGSILLLWLVNLFRPGRAV